MPLTVEVEMAAYSSMYLILMQAKSQGLEFDLEISDVLLGRRVVHHETYEIVRPNYNSIVLVRPKKEFPPLSESRSDVTVTSKAPALSRGFFF